MEVKGKNVTSSDWAVTHCMSLILNHLPENVSYCSFLDRRVCCISLKQLYLTSIELETVLGMKTDVVS